MENNEDIKILEEFKTKGYAMLLMKYGDRNTTNLKLEQAIENLIKRNKELEEENIHWKGQYHLENRKYIDLHNKKIDIPIINATEEMLQQYILKSKIKEIIEELKAEFHKLDKQIDIRKESRDMQDYWKDREKITTMQTISWLEGKLQDLLKGEDE